MLFNVYIFFLIASGVAMLVMGSLRLPYARRSRVLNFVMGAAFVIYGLYLLLFFSAGHVFIFFYAFILPIMMAVRFFRERTAYRSRRATEPEYPPAIRGSDAQAAEFRAGQRSGRSRYPPSASPASRSNGFQAPTSPDSSQDTPAAAK